MTFDAAKKPRNLARSVVLDLIRRTCTAHKNLNELWCRAVEQECGKTISDELASKLWPRRLGWKSLFIDDLRFVIAAAKLKPDLLTFAIDSKAVLPNELTSLGPAFTLLTSLAGSGDRRDHSKIARPAWVGSPNKLLAWLRGTGIDSGFVFLAWLWAKTESRKSYDIDVEDCERQLEGFEIDTLELIYNFSAIAYMFVTNRWYSAVSARFDPDMAIKLEQLVWVDLEAAEYDLDIGLQGIQEKGRTIESLLKGFQCAPGEVGILDVDFELVDENHGILTHKACPAVDRFEHYDDRRLQHCCKVCILAMPLSGEMLDENIACRPLKLPPRRDANDIACQWEYSARRA